MSVNKLEFENSSHITYKVILLIFFSRSKEVGYFPELTQCAEDRLKDLSPNNRLLRKSVAAVPKDCLETSERNEYLNDITVTLFYFFTNFSLRRYYILILVIVLIILLDIKKIIGIQKKKDELLKLFQ